MKSISTSLKKFYSFFFFAAIGFALALVITFLIKLVSVILLFIIGFVFLTILPSWYKNKFREE